MTHDSVPAGHPLVVDSRRLPRQPGAAVRLQAVVTVPGDLRNEVIGVPAGATVDVDLLLESVLDGILVTGRADIPEHGACVRCLEALDRRDVVEFRQFFTYPGAELPGDEATGDDVVPLTGQWLDLRDAFRDAVVLALPLTPACRSDCPGLCPECGFRLADDPNHRHEHVDPRWSGLAHLRKDLVAPEGE